MGDSISLFIQLFTEFSCLQLKDHGPISLLLAESHSHIPEAACIL